jgi:lactam utilization protein B
VQFEPERLKATIARMQSYQPAGMYLTHYGRVAPPARLAVDLVEQIDAMVAIAVAANTLSGHARHAALCAGLEQLYADRAQAHGCLLQRAEVVAILAMDIELNAQGLGVWLDREARA